MPPALRDVSLSVDFRPLLFEDFGCIVVNFYLPFTGHARTFKPQIKSADTSEQRTECDRFSSHF
jgi:hypothetical protein